MIYISAECYYLVYYSSIHVFMNPYPTTSIHAIQFESMSFIATSAYYKVVVEELRLPWDVSILTLYHTTQSVCSLTFTQLKNQYAHVQAKRLSRLCFHSMYIYTLLKVGFGMQALGTRVLFMNDVQGWEMGWPLGATLYEVRVHVLICIDDILFIIFEFIVADVAHY